MTALVDVLQDSNDVWKRNYELILLLVRPATDDLFVCLDPCYFLALHTIQEQNDSMENVLPATSDFPKVAFDHDFVMRLLKLCVIRGVDPPPILALA